jgi:mycothiol system anti-sigma-R factor
MNCKETVARLQTFLDRELSEVEIREVELHLRRCPPCLNMFDFEKELKLLVQRRACPESAPASLRERIRGQLFQE